MREPAGVRIVRQPLAAHTAGRGRSSGAAPWWCPARPARRARAAKPTSLCASPRRGMRLTGPRAIRRQRRALLRTSVTKRLRATVGEPSPSARTSRAWLLVPMRDGIGVRASLGIRRRRPRAWPARRASSAPGADPSATMRRTGPRGAVSRIADLPEPLARGEARGSAEQHERRVAPATARAVETAAVLGDGAAAVDRCGRARDADDERARPRAVNGERRSGLHRRAVGRGHRRGRVRLRGRPARRARAAAASAAAERRRDGSIAGHGRRPAAVALGGCRIKSRRGRRSARRRRCRR